jgi:hypothetical protein
MPQTDARGPVNSVGKWALVETLESLAFWLMDTNGSYRLAGPFTSCEVGITMVGEGGCWGEVSPALVEQMRKGGLLEMQKGGGPTLTNKGDAALRVIIAQQWLRRYGHIAGGSNG